MEYRLAIDIGASSGRHIVGCVDGDNVTQQEVYRFKNGAIIKNGSLIWDIDQIYHEIVEGIKVAFAACPDIKSLAIDTWGVDYVLLAGDKEILPCYAYRDSRTKTAIKEVHKIIPFNELYNRTGIQFMDYNTIYQLYADKLCGRLDCATDFLLLPEYFTYKLTGIKIKEYTEASTTGLIEASSGCFDTFITDKLGFPKRLFPELSSAGKSVGVLLPQIAEYVGGNLNVKLCASHDTASAFEAVDSDKNSVLISSGTWSLVGVKIPSPDTSKKSLEANFSNEGGVGYIRFLKNVTGMWISNCLYKQFNIEAADATLLAEQSTFNNVFNVDDECFSAPIDMKKAIDDWFAKNNEPAPKTKADYFRSAYRSLAARYAYAIGEIEKITGKTYDKVYIVGGGAKNISVNNFARQFTNKNIIPLPIEATAIGNIKSQAL